jgi:hypothetical protein
MKRFFLFLVVLILLPALASAQQTSALLANPLGGPISATSSACATAQSCVWMKLPPNTGTLGLTVTGTWTATLLLEESSDSGVTFTTAATLSSNATANSYSVSGMTDVRIRCSAYTSGVANISLQASNAGGSPSTSTVIPTGSNAIGTVGITNTVGSTDPCLNPSVLKSSAFANISTATTTALVTVSGTKAVYVCGFVLNMVATVAADTLYFNYGTGAACAGSPTALTSTFSSGILTNGAVSLSSGAAGTIFTAPASNGLCAVTTVGTGPAISVTVSYVQQ